MTEPKITAREYTCSDDLKLRPVYYYPNGYHPPDMPLNANAYTYYGVRRIRVWGRADHKRRRFVVLAS